MAGKLGAQEALKIFTPEKRSKTLKNTINKMKKEDPDNYKKHHEDNGKKTFFLHGTKILLAFEKYRKEHPEHSSELLKKTHREWRKRNPDSYYKHQSSSGILGGLATVYKLRCRTQYIWNGTNFMSGAEMECAKILLTKPILGINYQFKLNGKLIDFFPQIEDKLFQGCFVEYHPDTQFFDKHPIEKYIDDRKKVIENSTHKGIPLIVVTSLRETDGKYNINEVYKI
jgi:hypothetical protein